VGQIADVFLLLAISIAPYDSIWWWLGGFASGLKLVWWPLLLLFAVTFAMRWLARKAERKVDAYRRQRRRR